jgi:hypothetical protein
MQRYIIFPLFANNNVTFPNKNRSLKQSLTKKYKNIQFFSGVEQVIKMAAQRSGIRQGVMQT